MKIREAPVVKPEDKIVDVLPGILKSKCRCGIVVSENRVKGYLSLMNIVRRIAIEWRQGTEPHVAISKLQVRNMHIHPAPIVDKSAKPEYILMDMLAHDADIALVKDANEYFVATFVDLSYDLRHTLYGVTVERLVESQVWWSALPHITVKDAFMQLSVLPTWRLVVVSTDNSVMGVFSATDFFRALLEGSRPYEERLGDFLPEGAPLVADTDQAVVDVLYTMRRYNIYLVPVVEGIVGFKGVILAHDIARLAAVRAMGGSL